MDNLCVAKWRFALNLHGAPASRAHLPGHLDMGSLVHFLARAQNLAHLLYPLVQRCMYHSRIHIHQRRDTDLTISGTAACGSAKLQPDMLGLMGHEDNIPAMY
jgi:hypothetical protein